MTERRTRWLPLTVGSILVLLGVVTVFSIGMPIFVAGLFALVAGATHLDRDRPQVFWPAALGVASFFVTYVLLAPLSCTSQARTSSGGEIVGGTSCTNLLGIDYSGGMAYQPPLWPSALGGIVAAVLVAAILWRLLRDRGAR